MLYQDVTLYLFLAYILVNLISTFIYFRLSRTPKSKKQKIVLEFKKLGVQPPILILNFLSCGALLYFMVLQRKYHYRHLLNLQNLEEVSTCFDTFVHQELQDLAEQIPVFNDKLQAINIAIYCLLGIFFVQMTTICMLQVEYKACQYTCMYRQLDHMQQVPKKVQRRSLPSLPPAYLDTITDSEDENVQETNRS